MKRCLQVLSAVILIAILFASCTPSLKVTSDYDKHANLSQCKTFVVDTLNASQSLSQLNINRINNAVTSEMTKKGFSQSSTPDLLVHVSAILKDKASLSSTTNYYGYGGFYRPYAWGGGLGATGYTTYNVENYKDGSLIIDIADAKTKNLLWEGIGNKEIDKPSKDPEKEISSAVASIMANFPPGGTNK
jgi:hypothetical protein